MFKHRLHEKIKPDSTEIGKANDGGYLSLSFISVFSYSDFQQLAQEPRILSSIAWLVVLMLLAGF